LREEDPLIRDLLLKNFGESKCLGNPSHAIGMNYKEVNSFLLQQLRTFKIWDFWVTRIMSLEKK